MRPTPTLMLYDPNFWSQFFRNLPPFDRAVEERMLSDIATRMGMPYDFVRRRMADYLRGEVLHRLEPQPTVH